MKEISWYDGNFLNLFKTLKLNKTDYVLLRDVEKSFFKNTIIEICGYPKKQDPFKTSSKTVVQDSFKRQNQENVGEK